MVAHLRPLSSVWTIITNTLEKPWGAEFQQEADTVLRTPGEQGRATRGSEGPPPPQAPSLASPPHLLENDAGVHSASSRTCSLCLARACQVGDMRTGQVPYGEPGGVEPDLAGPPGHPALAPGFNKLQERFSKAT